jgi:TolB-like protein
VAKNTRRKLAAILSADVVGYSRLMGEDEAGTLDTLRTHREELIEPKITEHEGRIVKLMGDGLLADFPSAVEAVQCAIEIQHTMAERNADVPEDRQITYRIGVNLGDIIIEGDDIYGDGVNVAARVQEIAETGGVCVSGTVHDHVKGKVDFAFEDTGEQHVKNIADPVRVYRVAITGGMTDQMAENTQELPLPDKPSIAVLPFTNMSGDPEQEYFSDGMTEDIITELSRFRSLLVIARNSSFHYKGQSPKVQEIGRELGVRYVVEGSVRKAGNRVRITAQLVDAATGNHLWAERYDRDLEDIFAVQDEVVETIAANLGQNLRDAALVQARTRTASNLTAYDHLLRGRAAWWSGHENEAFEHLDRALAADPEYAAAHAWLALQYTYNCFNPTQGLTIEELAEKAREHAEAALRIDERDAFVQMAVSMAFTFTLGGDRARGFRHSDAAIALNPHDFDAMYCRAAVLAEQRRFPEALEWLDRARRLSPIMSYILAEQYCVIYYAMGEYEKSLDAISGQRGLPIDMYLYIASSNVHLGRVDEAASWIAAFERDRPEDFDTQAYLRLAADVHPNYGSYEERAEILRQAGLQI